MIRTSVLLGLVAAIFAGLGWLFGADVAAVALAVAVAAVFWEASPDTLLSRLGARKIAEVELLATVRRLAERAGVPAPAVFEIEERQANAFAAGLTPSSAALVLTTGLRRTIRGAELEAVLGHEIAHIRNRDTLAAGIGASLVGAIVSLALVLGALGFAMRRQGGGALIALAVVAPVAALVLHLAAGRSSEYRADRDGAELAGGPENMIAALRRLDAASHRLVNKTAMRRPALAALFIVAPLPATWLSRVFSTHPPIAARIRRLEMLMRA